MPRLYSTVLNFPSNYMMLTADLRYPRYLENKRHETS